MTIKILIADDHAFYREGVRAFLSNTSDMAVIGEANNGDEAIAKARELAPSVILMDLKMPGMNGIEATRRIHELSQQLKQGLAAMSHVTLHTPLSQDLSAGIVCFEVAGMTAREVVEQLRQRGIVGSVTPYAVQYARLAPGLYNTTSEIERTLEAIQKLRT